MSGQPDGGRLAGRVLAYLYNPGGRKKVPVERQKSDKIFGAEGPLNGDAENMSAEALSDLGLPNGERAIRGRVLSTYATTISLKSR